MATFEHVEIRGPWTATTIETYLDSSKIPLRIAVSRTLGPPIVLSVWFMRSGDELVGATRPTSTLIKCLERNPECGFEVASDTPPYRGVRGSAGVLLDREKGSEVLDHLLIRYLGSTETPLSEKLRMASKDEVAFRLQPSLLVSWDYSDRMATSLDPSTPATKH